MNITCIIVDDEPYAHEVLKSHVLLNKELNLVAQCFSVNEAKQFMVQNEVDLIFLDINMPDTTGLDWLKEKQMHAKVVLCTAYSEFALEAFDLNAVDYLLKPIALERFEKAISKVQKIMSADLKALSIKLKIGYNIFNFYYNEILYFQSVGNFIKVVCDNKSHLTLLTMHELESKLDANYFIRVHKSFIAPVSAIRNSFSTQKIVIGDTEIPIGRTYVEAVKAVLAK
jgi:DNA-binding LytR/AlgR family response regulator